MKITWHCPFCNHKSVVHNGEQGTVSEFQHNFDHDNKYKQQYVQGQVIVCPNDDCREYSLALAVGDRVFVNGQGRVNDTPKQIWRLVPDSDAKPFPTYIPSPLREDYREACLIRDHSPKASATLSRRCLQGMIRDFWGVKKGRLVDEIDAIKEKLDSGTWDAIDSVRSVGNIGAHMEKDINLVIDVEPGEAQLLLDLIETLFQEWYIAQHDRDERMKSIKALASAKQEAKNANKAEMATPRKPSD